MRPRSTCATCRDPTPSRADIEMTKQAACRRNLGIVVHDYIIVGKQGHASSRGAGADLVLLRNHALVRMLLGWI